MRSYAEKHSDWIAWVRCTNIYNITYGLAERNNSKQYLSCICVLHDKLSFGDILEPRTLFCSQIDYIFDLKSDGLANSLSVKFLI